MFVYKTLKLEGFLFATHHRKSKATNQILLNKWVAKNHLHFTFTSSTDY